MQSQIRIDRTVGIAIAIGLFFLGAFAERSFADVSVSVGFNNKVKLGCWTPMFFDMPADSVPGRFEIASPDGNGIHVKHSGQSTSLARGRAQGWFKLGRTIGTIEYRIWDIDDQEIGSGSISIGDKNAIEVLDSTVPYCLTIESSDTVAKEIKAVESPVI